MSFEFCQSRAITVVVVEALTDFALTADELKRIASLETGNTEIFDHHNPSAATALGSTRFDT